MKKSLVVIFLLLSAFCAWSKYGDVNGDGMVNSLDITILYNILLGDEDYPGGDLNFDNAVNSNDLTIVYNEMLNGADVDYDATYKAVSQDLDSYLEAHSDATYAQIQEYVAKYGGNVSTSVVDNVLYISTPDGRSIQVDRYGTFAPNESTEGEIDDSQMYQLLDDIETTLGDPGGSKASASNSNHSNEGVASPDDATRSQFNASSTSTKRVLNRRNILLWSPWTNNQAYERKLVKKIADANKLSYNEILNKNCTLASIKQFANYDIVVLACHGSKRGELVLPMYKSESFGDLDARYGKKGYSMTHVKVNGKWVNGVIPSYNNVKKNIPKLSRTILWTLMCHAYCANSVIRKIAVSANVADFYGATNEINTTPLGYLKKFTPAFYNGATSEKAFMAIENKRTIDYSYTTDDGTVSGKYCMSALCDVVYQKPRAINPIDNKPRGVMRIDPSMAHAVGLQSLHVPKSSDNGSSEVEAGFWFKNTGTQQVSFVPFDQQSIENVEVTYYGEIIGQYIVEGKTENLDEGHYEYRTYIKIDGSYYYSDDTYEIEIGNLCPDGNHPHMIDLGLPTGTKWACCNIGASSPTEYGNYYAWGETQPKDVYDWSTYKWCNGSNDTMTKYCTDSYYGLNGFVDNKTELDPADDAATANWGSGWRMPSLTQIQELVNNCSSEWTTRNGVNGTLFKSKENGASLFLPAAGYRWGSEFIDAGTGGYFWSRTLYSGGPKYACELLFYMCQVDWSFNYRGNGQSVRAVRVS